MRFCTHSYWLQLHESAWFWFLPLSDQIKWLTYFQWFQVNLDLMLRGSLGDQIFIRTIHWDFPSKISPRTRSISTTVTVWNFSLPKIRKWIFWMDKNQIWNQISTTLKFFINKFWKCFRIFGFLLFKYLLLSLNNLWNCGFLAD